MTPRTGRPKIAAGQRRNVILQITATKAEAAKIRGNAKSLGLTISEYLRSLAIPKE